MVQEKAEAFGKAAVAAATLPPKDAATAVGSVLAPVHKRGRPTADACREADA